MTTAAIKPGWAGRAKSLIGDGDAIEVASRTEDRLGVEWDAVDSAILAALQDGESVSKLNRLSERSQAYIRRLRSNPPSMVKVTPGDVRALALAWYDTYSDMMSIGAYAHIHLGVKQVEIARATGYSASAVGSWVKSARSVEP